MEVVTIVPACELEGNQWVKQLPDIHIRKKHFGLQLIVTSSSGCLQVLHARCEDNLCKLCLPEAPEDNYCKTVSVKIPKAPEDNYGKTYLLLMQLKLNSRYNSSRRRSPFDSVYGFRPRFGQPPMRYPLNKIVADTDGHGHVTNILELAKARQSFQANKSRNQAPRCKIGQKIMLWSQNFNLHNVNKKMKTRWL